MSLRRRTGSSGGRAVAGTFATLCCLAVVFTPGQFARAQTTDWDKVQEQNRQSCILVNGDPECMWHHPGPPRPAPPPKPDLWGAIAVSPSLAWGSSWNAKTREDAEREALKYCKATAGDSPCTIKVTVADVCVALVMSTQEKVTTIGGPTGASNFADSAATLRCQRAGGKACRVITSFCADGGRRHDLNGRTTFSNGNPIFTPGQATAPGRR